MFLEGLLHSETLVVHHRGDQQQQQIHSVTRRETTREKGKIVSSAIPFPHEDATHNQDVPSFVNQDSSMRLPTQVDLICDKLTLKP